MPLEEIGSVRMNASEEAEVLETGGAIEQLFKKSSVIEKDCSDYIVRKATLENVEMLHPCDLSYRPESGGVRRTVPMSTHAFGQLCAKIGVPVHYMKKCIQEKEYSCVVDNMNTWLGRHGRDLFIREYNGIVRGYYLRSTALWTLRTFSMSFLMTGCRLGDSTCVAATYHPKGCT